MWKFNTFVGFCFCMYLCTAIGEGIKLGDECEYQTDCEDIPNGICNELDECDCADDFVASPNNTICLETGLYLGDRCEIAKQCSTIPAAICLNHLCVLPEVPKLSKKCSNDSECIIPGQTCNNETCTFTTIAPKTLDLDKVNANTDKPKVIGMICFNDTDCSIEGSACIGFPKLCQCKEGLIVSHNLKSCFPKAKAIGDNCTETAQCVALSGTVCEDGKCTKLDTKFLKNLGASDSAGVKSPELMIGSSCLKNEECKHVENALCMENVCQCSENYITSVTSNSCLAKAKKEGDPCEIQKQCEDIKDAFCNQKKCMKPAMAGTKLGSGSSCARISQLVAIFLFMKLCFV